MRTCAIVAMAAWVGFAGIAPAQDSDVPGGAAAAGTQPAELLEKLIAGLGSEDVPERLAASAALAQDRSIPAREIEAALMGGDLSPEQHVRLERAALERFFSGPRPAMGVRFRDASPVEAVLDAAINGFDAFDVLRPGDRFESVAGVRTPTREDVRSMILSHDPGDEVALVLIRDGALVNATVRLGNYSDLNQGLDHNSLLMAWEARRTRLGMSPPRRAPIDPGIPRELWWGGRTGDARGWVTLSGPDESTHVVAGGESRPGAGGAGGVGNIGRQTRVQFQIDGGQFIIQGGPELVQQAEMLRRRFLDERALAERMIQQHTARLADPQTLPGQRRALHERVRALRLQIQQIDQSLARLPVLRRP